MLIKGKKKLYGKHNHIAFDGYVFKVKVNKNGDSITMKRVDELENPNKMTISKVKDSLFDVLKEAIKYDPIRN